MPRASIARLFVCSTQNDRDTSLKKVRSILAEQSSDQLWLDEEGEAVRIFVIVHRMAANRLGFGELFTAFNARETPSKFKDGFREGSHWALNPILRVLLPLAQAQKDENHYAVMSILRQHCPRFRGDHLSTEDLPILLSEVNEAINRLSEVLFGTGASKINDLVRIAGQESLVDFDERWSLNLESDGVWESSEADFDSTMESFLDCPAKQLLGYQLYNEERSLFDTQHGIKGTEFERVITILDDEEGMHRQYSYNKYFGMTALSTKDNENINGGKDSVLGRTQRLFYVSCSRATSELAVVYFTDQPEKALEKVRDLEIFSEDDMEIISLDC